jgi:hypothetical protein
VNFAIKSYYIYGGRRGLKRRQDAQILRMQMVTQEVAVILRGDRIWGRM